MTISLVKSEYIGHLISFNEGAWFNATEAATFYGKRPIDWLKQKEVKEYITLLCEFHKVTQGHFIKTRRGKNVGGTWFHPKLAIAFARWCDAAFAVWCDDQISTILAGKHPHFDWKRMRHSSSSSHKLMADSLKFARAAAGKETLPHHYVNESKLVNFVVTGRYVPVDRDMLTDAQLDLLAKIEIRNSLLISRGLSRLQRKELLLQYRDSLIGAIAFEQLQPVLEEAA